MRNKLEKILLIAIFIFPVFGNAAVITHTSTKIWLNTWSTHFEVTAGAGETVEEFTIFFDTGLYANLIVQNAPANWSVIAISPDPSIPADGFLDGLALSRGLTNGASVAGFVVQYEFLGTNAPGSQRFDIVDPHSFSTLSSGQTIKSVDVPPPNVIPVPGTLPLLVIGSVVLMKRRCRHITNVKRALSHQGDQHAAR